MSIRKGISLVELLIVIAILGVLATLGTPTFRRPPPPDQALTVEQAYDILIDLGFSDQEAFQFLLDNGWLPQSD